MKFTTFLRAADGSKFKFDSLIPKKEHRFQVAYHRGVHFRIFSPHVPHQKFADPLPA